MVGQEDRYIEKRSARPLDSFCTNLSGVHNYIISQEYAGNVYPGWGFLLYTRTLLKTLGRRAQALAGLVGRNTGKAAGKGKGAVKGKGKRIGECHRMGMEI